MSPTTRILIVDDDPDIRHATAHILQNAGYWVDEAADGEAALLMLQDTPPNLVLLDRDLPGMDGLEVCRQIKANPALAEVMVVLVSAFYTATAHQTEGLEQGADGYIARPVTKRDLLARVEAYAHILRLTRELREQAADLELARDAALKAARSSHEVMIEALAARERAEVATAELARMTELLERSGELAKIGGWQLHLPSMKLDWTLETFRISDLERTAEPSLADAINLFAPEARPVIAAAVQSAIDTGTPYDLELPIITAKGRHRWVQTQGFAEMKDGKAVRLFGTYQDITARKEASAELLAAKSRLEATLDALPDLLFELGLDGRYYDYHSASADLLAAPPEVFLGKLVSKVLPAEVAAVAMASLQEANERGRSSGREYTLALPGGTRWFELSVARKVLLAQEGPRFIVVSRDITDRKQAEAERANLEGQLRQAQKLESVGRLAGGVAHDFNNMLGIILGHAELAMQQVDPAQPLRVDLEEIQKAAQRSAVLTRQLLAFARKQDVSPRALAINASIAETLSLLKRLIGEDITVVWHPAATAWPVWMDPSQLDQIITNLCINARDAIAGVGTITVSTGNSLIDTHYCASHIDATPGEYCMISISDTGSGMDQHTLSLIFEPFFTTKAVGERTGLGLAMVNGAVRQNYGFISVTSAPGRGSTFEIFLPRYAGSIETAKIEAQVVLAPVRKQTILIVEDEPVFLKLTARILSAQGYIVLSAARAADAIRLAQAHSGSIDLLLTDVIMPGMSGRDVAQAMRSISPNIKCLFMSGYTADIIANRGVVDEGVHFIQKPFAKDALCAAVRAALDADV